MEYRDGLFEMTRTVKSWLDGFPARLESAERELGLTRDVQAAKAQHEEVRAAEARCVPGDGKAVRDVVHAASKLNNQLIFIERDMREARATAASSRYFRRTRRRLL